MTYIKIDEDSLEEAIRETLKEHIILMEENPDLNETPDKNAQLLGSLYATLEFFSAPSEYVEFVKDRT